MKKVYLPVPYPGECLYSVFCRYHVRSGNTPAQTAMELAANSGASFGGSVLSPKILFSPASQNIEVRGMRTTDLVMGEYSVPVFLTHFLDGSLPADEGYSRYQAARAVQGATSYIADPVIPKERQKAMLLSCMRAGRAPSLWRTFLAYSTSDPWSEILPDP